jgi:hypothetical protein
VNLEEAVWRIPAARMKMKDAHPVPLSRQAAATMAWLHGLTGTGRLLFPDARTKERAISDVAINAALRRMGFGKDELAGHGFRATASTLLNEAGFPPDLIELQLAHKERNSVRAAYNRAERLKERAAMMQEWADHLDALRDGTPQASDRVTPPAPAPPLSGPQIRIVRRRSLPGRTAPSAFPRLARLRGGGGTGAPGLDVDAQPRLS